MNTVLGASLLSTRNYFLRRFFFDKLGSLFSGSISNFQFWLISFLLVSLLRGFLLLPGSFFRFCSMTDTLTLTFRLLHRTSFFLPSCGALHILSTIFLCYFFLAFRWFVFSSVSSGHLLPVFSFFIFFLKLFLLRSSNFCSYFLLHFFDFFISLRFFQQFSDGFLSFFCF